MYPHIGLVFFALEKTLTGRLDQWIGASTTGVFALVVALTAAIGAALAAEGSKYPNWKGQWDAINPTFGGQGVKFDPTKRFGPAQQAPLTPAYQKILRQAWPTKPKAGRAISSPTPIASPAACRA